jgi:hypothetical protein
MTYDGIVNAAMKGAEQTCDGERVWSKAYLLDFVCVEVWGRRVGSLEGSFPPYKTCGLFPHLPSPTRRT